MAWSEEWREVWPYASLVGAAGALAWGLWLLLLPAPPAMGDLPGMMLVGGAFLAALIGGMALHHRATDTRPREDARRARRWMWWAGGAYAGVGLAALVLGHRDMGRADFERLGAIGVAYHAVAHVVIAPLDLAIGFAVGFLQEDALLVVVGCVLFMLLAADLLRRRLTPRPREQADEDAATS